MKLTENIDFAGADFVEEAGHRIIKGVAMLGPVSSHGYEYEQPAMAKAVSGGLYENVRIFINHGQGNRDIMHLAGIFKNSRHESNKVRGDAHLLDDAYGKKFWDIAQQMPEAAGCSHVADGKLVTKNGKKVVEAIDRVYSVDLVVQGATTHSVFEGNDPANPPATEITISPEVAEQLQQADRLVKQGWRLLGIDPATVTVKEAGHQPAEREIPMSKFEEKMRERDQQLAGIEKIMDPRYQDIIVEETREREQREYEERQRNQPTKAQIVELASVLASTGRETDEEFSARCTESRRVREETARAAAKIAEEVFGPAGELIG